MNTQRIDPCPCGCDGDVPTATGFGTTPFISVNGIKVYLATDDCRTRYTEKFVDEKIVRLPTVPVKAS